MVMEPSSFTFEKLDFDILLSNISHLRAEYEAQKRAQSQPAIKQSADVQEARKIAQILQKHFAFPPTEDFMFLGNSFYNPLAIFDWLSVLPKSQLDPKKTPRSVPSKKPKELRKITLRPEVPVTTLKLRLPPRGGDKGVEVQNTKGKEKMDLNQGEVDSLDNPPTGRC